MPDRRAVWAVLVEECGANPDLWGQFQAWPDCGEFRFQGRLGFGGKVYSAGERPPYVGYYCEDETPERQAIRVRTNTRLDALTAGAASRVSPLDGDPA